MADVTIRKNEAEHKYEAHAGGEIVGFIDYSEDGDTVTMPHTEVNPDQEGKGIGSALVRHALDDVRDSGKKVNPVCPFIATYIKRHRDYQNLVADD